MLLYQFTLTFLLQLMNKIMEISAFLAILRFFPLSPPNNVVKKDTCITLCVFTTFNREERVISTKTI